MSIRAKVNVKKNGKRVLVAMSGGVDSSVTACILKNEGYEVIGLHMRLWKQGGASAMAKAHKASENQVKKIAKKIGIPLIICDLKREFKEKIVDTFTKSYELGLTPNPCVNCNREIKFGLLLDKMKELRADFLATGHYARITKKIVKKHTVYSLIQAKDGAKDQSYFLYTLTQNRLKHILFPLGNYTKPEVRELARKYGYDELNDQKESQDLCFMAGIKPSEFLEKNLPKKAFKPGPIITVSGKNIGTHNGLPFYTIGQRKGIGMGGGDTEPLYVIRIDPKKNTLIVGTKDDLFTKELIAKDISFVEGKPPRGTTKLEATIRYRSPRVPVTINLMKNLTKPKSAKEKITAKVVFSQPQRAVTPGQSVVFYNGEKVIGGGIIE
jgi:tRNA-specific 2-thiouridylase